MQRYRISKYSPELRNPCGVFIGDDWTSCSDIGQTYHGKEFTVTQYLDVESKYIEVITMLLRDHGVESILVSHLEKNFTEAELDRFLKKIELPFSSSERELFAQLRDGMQFNLQDVVPVMQLILRECLWCELVSKPKTVKVIFGYDYYVYIEGICIGKEEIFSYANQGIYIDLQ